MTDIRILGGKFRGTKLLTLDGDTTRPTTSRIVENIFNILMHNKFTENFHFQQQKVLDIFAGSGRLGLEALSRGAIRAVFVENHIDARSIIRENIMKCHATGVTKLFTRSALDPGEPPPQAKAPFSLIFCDAPYYKELPQQAIPQFIKYGWIEHNALFCIETEKEIETIEIEKLTYLENRLYGNTRIHFLIYHQN